MQIGEYLSVVKGSKNLFKHIMMGFTLFASRYRGKITTVEMRSI